MIKDRERSMKIDYKLPAHQQKVIDKINGMYGIIGPDIDIKKVNTIYDLFIGDGCIQSIFFEHGELTYVKKFIRTEKLVYEEECGRIPKGILHSLLFMMLKQMNLFPNVLGLANTALLNVKNKVFALYERDQPYLLDIDLDSKSIETIKKVDIGTMDTFSAHSKYTDRIESIDYHIFSNIVTYNELYENFTSRLQKEIKMEYLPVIHDFYSDIRKVVLVDSPLFIDLTQIFTRAMPVTLCKHSPTVVHVFNKTTLSIEKYYSEESFYLFHYADCVEDDRTITIYASLYDELDFSELNIRGKYRKIVMDKETKNVNIIRDPVLENMDIEFPIRFLDKVVFRSIENKRTNGFVVCKGMDIVKKITFEDRFISGEPAIVFLDQVPYLIAFAFNEKFDSTSFLLVIDMNTYEIIEIPISESLSLGFHSIFLHKLH
jgi:carotenoid cleavage dioxygenase-like enzyme